MSKNAIYVTATGQNVGKTTLCLGILAGLKKRYSSVGFTKPVGQEHVSLDDHTKVDKDVVIFKNYFHLEAQWSDMSPIIIPPGFTRSYLDHAFSEETLMDKIHTAYRNISSSNEYTIVEGTGHVGVGSIVNLNNAEIAASLGIDVVIITSGGLGSAHDELALNFAMCERHGVKVRGVILNRVFDEKREMILDYFPRTLKKWGIPLIGCIPYNDFLSNPTMRDYEILFNTSLLSGKQHHYRHFNHFRLVAGSLEKYKIESVRNQLVIIPAAREDIIHATVEKHSKSLERNSIDIKTGIIFTGSLPPCEKLLEEIREAGIPSLYAPISSYNALKMINTYIVKIRTKDHSKIEKAIQLVTENINFDILCAQKITA